MKKLTVTFPDGTTGSRRTPRPYTWVIASRLDTARPARARVKYRHETCPEGAAIHAAFEPEYAALRDRTGIAVRPWTTEKSRAWEDGWRPLFAREKAAHVAHRATCPAHCDGYGRITIEISRTPEPTGWRPISWHHSLALAEKALATSYTAWRTEGLDEVRIFPVDEGRAPR